MSRAFYITTPIYYVNDKPHIGHAYTTIACDVMARFKRLDGFQVKFLTGTDEHGQKVAKAAAEKGMTPQALCDLNAQNFRDLAKTLGASNDDFIRTTEPRHIRSCQALWEKLRAKGEITLGKYEGWYAVRDEAFYDDSELVTNAAGEKVAPSGAPVEWMVEENYSFPLSKWQDRLLAFYDANPDFIAPKSRFNEVYSFVKGGLMDLSISRTAFTWGIPVPNDPKHVMYVWIDALTNYITALGHPDDTADFKTFWSDPDSFAMHMVGKDIIRFHCVYWPAFLMAADLPLPKRVFAHGWWTVEGQKMSKSLGNAIDPNEMVAKYGLDQFRYFMMREVPFGNDGDFSEAAIAGKINGELANELGNLVQRYRVFAFKNLGLLVPRLGALLDDDKILLGMCVDLLPRCRSAIDRQAFHEALEAIWSVIRAANVYVDKQAPWNLKKTNQPDRLETVLYVLTETTRFIGIHLQPYMPEHASKILDQLEVPLDKRLFANLEEAPLPPEQATWFEVGSVFTSVHPAPNPMIGPVTISPGNWYPTASSMVSGTSTQPPSPVFPRIEVKDGIVIIRTGGDKK